MHQRERELASQCSLTLITEAGHELHSLIRPSSRTDPLLQILHVSNGRYDLISIPTFHDLEHDVRRMQMLIENINLAVDVHSAEKVCVLGYDDAESICEHLYRELQPRFQNLSFGSVFVGMPTTASAREPSRRLVVTCMDFRLHHEDGLQGGIVGPTAWLTYPGAAFAGIDKETKEIFFADLDRVLDREAVDELTLVSHTDCARYAAKYSWRNIKEEMEQLANDLLAIANRIRSRYSHLTVFCVIANVEEGAVKKLYPVW